MRCFVEIVGSGETKDSPSVLLGKRSEGRANTTLLTKIFPLSPEPNVKEAVLIYKMKSASYSTYYCTRFFWNLPCS